MAGSCRPSWVLLLGSMLAVGVAARADAVARADAAAMGVGPALEAIDACVHRLTPDIDVGYDRIAARCPMLVRRLDESGVAVWLPHDWRTSGNDLSAGGLRSLSDLLVHEFPVTPPLGSHQPGIQHVPEILAGLTHADDEHSGLWARTRVWLRGIFAGTDETADEGWLGRVMGQSGVPQTVLELVSYGALGLVLVLALVIVGNELRVGGIWGGGGGRRRLGARGPAEALDAVPGGVRLDWEGVRGSPVAQRLGLLLELVVARLNEAGGERLSRGLTARELLGAARLADERDRERLRALVRASEWVRFSGGAASEGEVAVVMEEGRRLLEGIGTAGALGPGVGA